MIQQHPVQVSRGYEVYSALAGTTAPVHGVVA